MTRASDEMAQAVQKFEERRKLKNLAIPTDQDVIRKILRHLKHPITLFGEREV